MATQTRTKKLERRFSDAYLDGTEEKDGTVIKSNKLRQTGEGLLRDVAVGVIGGGLASAVLGRYSFLVGLGITGLAHYSENKTLSALGLGMMAAGTFTALTNTQQEDKRPAVEKVTERLGAFKSDLKRKVWLDYFEKKLVKLKKPADETVNGTTAKTNENGQSDYFKKDTRPMVNPDDYPEMTEEEKEFVAKKIDEAINREATAFYENRTAVNSYLKTSGKVLESEPATDTKPAAYSERKNNTSNTPPPTSRAQSSTNEKKHPSESSNQNSYPESPQQWPKNNVATATTKKMAAHLAAAEMTERLI